MGVGSGAALATTRTSYYGNTTSSTTTKDTTGGSAQTQRHFSCCSSLASSTPTSSTTTPNSRTLQSTTTAILNSNSNHNNKTLANKLNPLNTASMSTMPASHGHSEACCNVPAVISKGYDAKGTYEELGGLNTCKYRFQSKLLFIALSGLHPSFFFF